MVYDEADRMLSMGFYPDMREVQRYLPKRPIHTCMFSATFPDSVLRTAQEFIRDGEFLSLSSDHIHVTDTEHVFYIVPGMDKDRSLVRLIEIENPASAIIFCNTKARVHYVSVVLQRFGYDADELSADLSQTDRERVLDRVRKGTLRFLVATDVAARGLDIPALSHVIQYEPPDELEAYIHRAGRTGRAGASGVAISLVNRLEKYTLDKIAKTYSIPFEERPIPSDADVAAVVAERTTALLEARLRGRDKLQTERSRGLPLSPAAWLKVKKNCPSSPCCWMSTTSKPSMPPWLYLPEKVYLLKSRKSRNNRKRRDGVASVAGKKTVKDGEWNYRHLTANARTIRKIREGLPFMDIHIKEVTTLKEFEILHPFSLRALPRQSILGSLAPVR